ncbi:titin homolog [Topomyia yanbarensis]|uniref:titin homolog n=1 Tax=Topomyia yanbarensis TaxID=2498891 RepID=UPI00273B80B5|nr:titin homolog [Topomyia yanbarensis]
MERFAINILHKQIYKICRLCGVDNPVKFPIIDENETVIVGDDDEATLVRKIEECVGIQVCKDDRMPQNICSLCVDKINDFFEYRLMCAATNLQTRTILNLPLVDPTRKLIPPIGDGTKLEVKDVKTDVKKVVEAASTSGVSSTSSTKKGKKRRASPSPSPSPAPTTRVKAAVDIVKDEPVPTTPVKALTKKERLKQLQQQQKEKEERKLKDDKKKLKEDDKKKIKEDDKKKIKEDDKKKVKEEDKKKVKEDDKKKVKDEDKKKIKDEDKKKIKDEDKKKIKDEDKKKKEIPVEISSELKHTRSKRKESTPPKEVSDVELSVPAPKKIKFEHPCSYCSDEFKTQTELDGHLISKHTPLVRKFGCGSCRENFDSVLEFKDHNLWHQLTRTLYTCFKCKRKYDKNAALVKHVSLNACGRVSRGRPPAIKPDVQCRLCNKKFKTQNLYEWHSCFLKPKANCPKCNKFFVKKPVLTRHYMMFCTGSLPPPEPVIIPKEEPVDSTDKKMIGSSGAAPNSAERRTRRSVPAEPELPKEEREIPFPPPLELAQEVATSPSGSKKKTLRFKETVEVVTPTLETAKITSLLDSGAKLGRDTDIATINNLLSSVTEAIASLSEAKAKKKKKRKDKNKEKERTDDNPPAGTPLVETPVVTTPVETALTETPPVGTPSPVDDSTVAIAMEVGEMSLDQQLAFCSDKLPMVVLAKTQFKQECTEIDMEPSQLQEPMDEDDVETNDFEDTANDFADFQSDDEDAEEQEDESGQQEKEPQVEKSPSHESTAEEEESPFPMPIKQEPDIESQNEDEEKEEGEEEKDGEEEEHPPADASSPNASVLPAVASVTIEKEPHFDVRFAINIKKEPGLEEESEPPPAKRKRPESRSCAETSISTKIVDELPRPLIITIKKEKGLLNASVAPTAEIRTIVLDDEDDDDELSANPVQTKGRKRVYKKPNFLAVKIKQEKIDPTYDQQEKLGPEICDLPGNIQIKQEPVDDSLPRVSKASEKGSEGQLPVEQAGDKNSPSSEKSASPIIAFDGVRIKQEKQDTTAQASLTPELTPVQDPKPVERKKKSKVKINPFALLKQRMAAEAAAKSLQGPETPVKATQASSPLPVITNVVGNAPAASRSSSLTSSSGRNTPISEVEVQQRVTVPSITPVISKATTSEADFPMPIKREIIDEITEDQTGSNEGEQAELDDDFPMPIKEEVSDTIPEDNPDDVEEPDFPMPIKEELEESEIDDGQVNNETEGNLSREEDSDHEPCDKPNDGELQSEEDEQSKVEESDNEKTDKSKEDDVQSEEDDAMQEEIPENGEADLQEKVEKSDESNDDELQSEEMSENGKTEKSNEDDLQSDEDDAMQEEMPGSQKKELQIKDESHSCDLQSEEDDVSKVEEPENGNDEKLKEDDLETDGGNAMQEEMPENEEVDLMEQKKSLKEESDKSNERADLQKEEDELAKAEESEDEKSENSNDQELENEENDASQEKVSEDEEEDSMKENDPQANKTDKSNPNDELRSEDGDSMESEKSVNAKEDHPVDQDECVAIDYATSSGMVDEEKGKLSDEKPTNDEDIEMKDDSSNSTDNEEDDCVQENNQREMLRTEEADDLQEFLAAVDKSNQKEQLSDEQENSTSSISDIPMEEYEQVSHKPFSDCNTEVAETKRNSDLFSPSCANQVVKSSEVVSEFISAQLDVLQRVAESTADHHPVAGSSVDVGNTQDDVLETVSLSPISPSPKQRTPSQSDFDELQNLLTEGLKPSDISSSVNPDAVVSSSSTSALASDANGASVTGLDDLDSLLNNKLEEISDQLKSLPPSAETTTTATQNEDISLAFERELLHEMMPQIGNQNSDALRTEMNPMPTNSSSVSDNGILYVDPNPLVDGSTGAQS